MRINFVRAGGPHLASYRWRQQKPAHMLNNRSENTAIISEEYDPDADINVFAKHFNMQRDANAIYKAKSKTLMDICDDHFDRDAGSYYEFMCKYADVITCPTPNMQARIYEVTGRLARIVPDPISFPDGDFKYNPDPKFLWYGHASNVFPGVYKIIDELPNLTICTNTEIPNLPSHVNYVPWAPGVVESIIKDFDIVVIPKNTNSWAVTKSPNRAVDAINAGKWVITDFAEVYQDLAPFLWLGDLKEGIQFYHTQSKDVEVCVRTGQNFVRDVYGDQAVFDCWKLALNSEKEI